MFVIQKIDISHHELVLTHTLVKSKYRAICLTPGIEGPAHTQCRLFILEHVSFYTYALSISRSSSDAFESPPTFFPF